MEKCTVTPEPTRKIMLVPEPTKEPAHDAGPIQKPSEETLSLEKLAQEIEPTNKSAEKTEEVPITETLVPIEEPTEQISTFIKPAKETQPTSELGPEVELTKQPLQELELEKEVVETIKPTEELTQEAEAGKGPEKKEEPTREPAQEVEHSTKTTHEIEISRIPDKELDLSRELVLEEKPTRGPSTEAEEAKETAEPTNKADHVERTEKKPEPTVKIKQEDKSVDEKEPTTGAESEDKTHVLPATVDKTQESAESGTLEDKEDGTSEATEDTTEGKERTTSEVLEELVVPETSRKSQDEITPVIVSEDIKELWLGTEVNETLEVPVRPPSDSEILVPLETTKETTPQVAEHEPVTEYAPGIKGEVVFEDLSNTTSEVMTEVHPGTISVVETIKQVTPEEVPSSEDGAQAPEDVNENILESPAVATPETLEEFTPETVVEAPTESTQDTTTIGDSAFEATIKYVVETNNGNFPVLTKMTYEEDDNLLGNNGFLLENEQNSIGNEIDDTLLRPPRPLKDQVVELRIKLRGETYNDALRDPTSFEYQQLARQFKRKTEDIFEKLPGFKSIDIIEFRPQKDLKR
ncbi:proteoglycan 4 [Nematolebias whitei]|uniref:proteoglycan 4 n=1 Tax=Nematolebias whitei TaxID=451745 RepID=UPI0018995B67|nr:proteoglycan 4 [Nematolebias whitei]